MLQARLKRYYNSITHDSRLNNYIKCVIHFIGFGCFCTGSIILTKQTLICSYLNWILKESLCYPYPFYENVPVTINYPLQLGALSGLQPLNVEVEWIDEGIEGGGLTEGWGLVAVDVAGQFIHLHCISLCCRFGVSAPLPEYHCVVTCTKERI